MVISVLAAFSVPASGKAVDPSQAALVAKGWYEVRLEAAQECHLGSAEAITVLTADAARSIVVKGTTVAYAFDIPGGGCIAIAADDELAPILYYSLRNRLAVPAVPPAQAIIEAFADKLASVEDEVDEKPEGAHPLWVLLSGQLNAKVVVGTLAQFSSAPVGPLLTTAWSQHAPFKDRCPIYKGDRCWPGCVAIGMAQIMRYWQHPTRGSGSHCYHWSLGDKTICVDFSSTTYDWANMPDKADSASPQTVKDAVAALCYHCGVAADTEFTPRGSAGSFDGKVLTKYFGYKYTRFVERSNYSDTQWYELMSSQTDSGQPILYRIEYKDAGHLVVLDGYQDPNLFHLNMGWGGYQDGWYAIGGSTEVSSLKNWAVVDIRPHYNLTTYYVDCTTGSDAWDGTAPIYSGRTHGPKKTIQAAIYATGPHDTVIVADGTYTGPGNRDLDVGDKLITVRSANGPTNCIIDCERRGRGVYLDSGATEAARVDGFTIRNGSADYGGGIFCWYGTPTIINCVISGNAAEEVGGGLYGCNGTIQNCIITGNSASFGGGLAFCDGAIRNCVISENTAEKIGGGVCDCGAIIQNGTIVQNSAQWGGGLAYCDGEIGNCIIWRNSASYGPQTYESSSPTYSCVEGWTGGSEKTMSNGPRFVQGSYRLLMDSPCIDAGKNEDWMWQAVDLDGNPRIFLGTSFLTVDMGAYEYGYFPFKVVKVLRPSNGNVELTWNSRPGDTYTIWSRLDLCRGDWLMEATIPSQGKSTTWTDQNTAPTSKFYRVEIK